MPYRCKRFQSWPLGFRCPVSHFALSPNWLGTSWHEQRRIGESQGIEKWPRWSTRETDEADAGLGANREVHQAMLFLSSQWPPVASNNTGSHQKPMEVGNEAWRSWRHFNYGSILLSKEVNGLRGTLFLIRTMPIWRCFFVLWKCKMALGKVLVQAWEQTNFWHDKSWRRIFWFWGYFNIQHFSKELLPVPIHTRFTGEATHCKKTNLLVALHVWW